MILYIDTSALLKRYVREEHSEVVASAIREASELTLSVIAYAEVRAALARKLRDSALPQQDHAFAVRAFDRDWRSLLSVDVTLEIAFLAGDIAERLALRGFDAVHLATALWLYDRSSEPVQFLTFDNRLIDAARQMMPVYEWVEEK